MIADFGLNDNGKMAAETLRKQRATTAGAVAAVFAATLTVDEDGWFFVSL